LRAKRAAIFRVRLRTHAVIVGICDAQVHRPAAELGATNLVQDQIDASGRDAHEGHIVANVDRSDVAAGDAGLVGNRPDHIGGTDPVAASDFHAKPDRRIGIEILRRQRAFCAKRFLFPGGRIGAGLARGGRAGHRIGG